MKTTMLGFIAETAIHCGAGRSSGIVDLPVAREAATDYPFIPGSGLKGSMRDRATQLGRNGNDVDEIFGKPDNAGNLLVSDARILLLPVRSLTGVYRWVTCPLVLERYARDRARCGLAVQLPSVAVAATDGAAAARAADKQGDKLFLEEREFAVTGACPKEVIEAIAPLIRHEQTRERLARQLVVLSNDDFAWFCRNALPIQARNVLDDETKKSMNLWYEESLPPDSVLYALLIARNDRAETAVSELFPDTDPYLQIGGNETVGHGWTAVAVYKEGVS